MASLGGQLDFTSKFKTWVLPRLLDGRRLRKESPNQQELGAVRMVPWEGTTARDSSETIMTWINFFQTQVLKEDLDYLHSDLKLSH